jgi:hypothetical protein
LSCNDRASCAQIDQVDRASARDTERTNERDFFVGIEWCGVSDGDIQITIETGGAVCDRAEDDGKFEAVD